MKEFLKHVPGFRTDTKWKKVVASVFYVLHILMSFVVGLDYFLIVGGLALFIFTIVQLVVNLSNEKSLKKPSLLLLAAILMFSTGLNIDSKADIEAKEAEQIKLVEEQRMAEEEEKQQERLELEEAKEKELEEAKRKEEARLEEEEKTKLAEAERIAAEEQAQKEELELAEKLKKEEEEAAKAAIPAPSEDTSSSSGGGSSTGSSTQTGQGEVFITPTGSKYHRRACGRGNYSATTLEDAKSRGLEPCKKCY